MRHNEDADYDDDRSDHERGVCDGAGMCDDCDAAEVSDRRRDERASRPGRGSRSAHHRLDHQREMQRTRLKRCPNCRTIPTQDCPDDCVPF